jgi:hypothetical protein
MSPDDAGSHDVASLGFKLEYSWLEENFRVYTKGFRCGALVKGKVRCRKCKGGLKTMKVAMGEVDQLAPSTAGVRIPGYF